VAAYKVGKPYEVGGIWYVPREQPDYDRKGTASWYGDAFNMKATASGEIFDMNAVSAAHTTLPLPCIVEVTNLDNGRKLLVRVNDRGPFVGDRIIDLSHEAARQLGYDRAGLAHVRVRYVGPADLPAPGRQYAALSAPPPKAMPIPPASPLAAARPVAALAATATPLVEFWSPRDTTPATVAPPQAVSVASIPAAVEPPVPLAALAADAPLFKVQAGAFSDPLNAQRAVNQLSSAGKAVIEPLDRDGVTLYRVVVPGGADEVQAEALRQRVMANGFTDAHVLRPAS
jgi:rare lipoprotein A